MMYMYKQFDSAAARKCPVVIHQNTQATHKKRREKKPDGVHFFFLRIFSRSCYPFRTADDDSANFVLFGFQLNFLIFLFPFLYQVKSQQKISQHCGAEKKVLYCMCDNMYIPHLTSLVGRVVCTRRPAVCLYKNFCSFFFIFRPTFEI